MFSYIEVVMVFLWIVSYMEIHLRILVVVNYSHCKLTVWLANWFLYSYWLKPSRLFLVNNTEVVCPEIAQDIIIRWWLFFIRFSLVSWKIVAWSYLFAIMSEWNIIVKNFDIGYQDSWPGIDKVLWLVRGQVWTWINISLFVSVAY